MTNLAHLCDSNGHGCMLQYALLHLYGYELSIDDLKAFRVSPREFETLRSLCANLSYLEAYR
jgi:hypothetical protein